MLSRPELAVQRFMLSTQDRWLRSVWGAIYLGIARAVAASLNAESSAVYLAGSLARGDPVYGLSDIDLVVVALGQASPARIARRLERLYRVIPPLRRLTAHVWLYDHEALSAVTESPFPTFGLESGRPAFIGEQAPHDPMALLERPGLRPPAQEWRRLRGSNALSATPRARQDDLIAGWLELQYRWKWACRTFLEGSAPALAGRAAILVAEAARTWLSLVADEHLVGRRAALARASQLLEADGAPLREALRILERFPQSSRPPRSALWTCFVRLCGLVARRIDEEVASSGRTPVLLVGASLPRGMPLRDWRGLVVPPVEWSTSELPTARVECFTLQDEDPADLGAVARAARLWSEGNWPSLRSGALLVRPSRMIWATHACAASRSKRAIRCPSRSSSGAKTLRFRRCAGGQLWTARAERLSSTAPGSARRWDLRRPVLAGSACVRSLARTRRRRSRCCSLRLAPLFSSRVSSTKLRASRSPIRRRSAHWPTATTRRRRPGNRR